MSFRYRDNKAEMIGNLVFLLEVSAPIPNEVVKPVKLLIIVYNNPSITVAIDEMDSGIFITAILFWESKMRKYIIQQ